jgi:hypothetical protein
MHSVEPLVPESSSDGVEGHIKALNRYKPPGTDHIPVELVQTRGKTLRSKIHKIINSFQNKKELLQQRKVLLRYPLISLSLSLPPWLHSPA